MSSNKVGGIKKQGVDPGNR